MKHSINVNLQPVKGGGDCRPVRLRVSWSGRRCDLSLGVSYNAAKWSKETGRARPNTRNDYKQTATEVNGLIEDAVRWVDAWFVKCEVSGCEVSPRRLADAFNVEFKKKNSGGGGVEDLRALLVRFIVESAKVRGWSHNTCRKYTSLRAAFARYDLRLSDFGSDFLSRYVGDAIKNGMKNSSIARNVGVFKFFGRWLLNNGYAVGDVSDFDVRLKWTNGAGKAVIFLEWLELSALLAAADGGVFGGTPGAVVDMFLFSCFSGLRYSDVSALRVGDVRDGKIHVVTQKTTAALEIELNKYTKRIYDKYSGIVGSSPDSLLFPPHTSQTCNRELKVCFRRLGLCRMVEKISFCGSERLQISSPLCDVVSFHAARRTFVVECLRRGIAPAVIMKWTGHSDYSAMKPYIEIVDSLKSSEMSKFDA